MTVTEEIYELDIDLEVINHLPHRDSVAKMQQEQIKPELIRDELARKVFKWQMQHLRDYGEPATSSVIEDEFGDVSLDDPETNVVDLIIRLRTRYLRNEGKEAVKRIAEIAVDEPLETAQEMARESRRLLDLTVTRGEVYGTGDFPRALDEYHKAVLRGKGPALGYEELDDHFYGQMGVTFLIAAPKHWKSWLAIKAVLENVEQDYSPYLFSLELPTLESYWRLACMNADIPYWKYLKKALMPGEEREAQRLMEELDSLGSLAVDKPPQGQRGAAQIVQKAIDAGSGVIFIDQLQYMENRKGISIGATNSTADYFEVVNDLRNYSDSIPIFVVHQFNRSTMGSDSMPEVQQAKGSSAIEEVATLALGLWANKDMRASGVVELGTLASRNYGLASWELGVSLSRNCSINMIGRKDD